MNSARKGKSFEQKVVRLMNEAGLDAKRTRLSGHGQDKPSDFRVVINQTHYTGECKKRKSGWAELYSWTGDRQMAVVAADRREPLVVMRLEDFLEIVA